MTEHQLIRVVTNLVKNGIQAIPDDKIDPQIDVKVGVENDMVKLTVEDNGIGISEENKTQSIRTKIYHEIKWNGIRTCYGQKYCGNL